VVKIVLHIPTSARYVFKTYEKYRFSDPDKKNSVRREISILEKLDCPYICKLYEIINT
jgi:serine/threonine protein kinase